MTHSWTLAPALAAAILSLLPALAAAQPSNPLNDTGQTQCVDNSGQWPTACDAASTGDAASVTHPGQDGRFGRDAAQGAGALPPKIGGGAAGFDFTRICWNGAAEGTATCTGTLVDNRTGSQSATPATDWACTRDNVTGLVWSLQSQEATWNTATGTGYPDAGHNTASRCGYTDWRLPTVRELLSIVHHGKASSPVVDAAYFPGTVGSWYWSRESYAPNAAFAWYVYFNYGYTFAVSKTITFHVRLVRSGQ